MILTDKYAYNNKLRNFNPMVKFLFAMGMLVISLLKVPIVTYFFIIILMVFITVGIAKIPYKQYLKMLAIPGFFLVISMITILISISKDKNVFIYCTNIMGSYIVITQQSINTCKLLMLRAISCITCTYFIAFTIPINQLIMVFKKLKIPKSFIELVVLIYRFIFIFLEESKEIHTAQELRFGYINVKTGYKSLSLLVKCLFIRIMIKYEDMVISLDSKLYDGEFHI
ncbi:cobalt ECF transporter T component CbiQ [Haloimpatiens sp. FM7330]|uniref:cobalt ECF transporter T component CbiQ n=1 Tax=Haloimpatiens sp. FM7330 TaxID=3298610 RepID=UPI00363656BA